ncbi:MAG: hypothetical protein ABI640_22085 [Gammaproteobacteria bacterium]
MNQLKVIVAVLGMAAAAAYAQPPAPAGGPPGGGPGFGGPPNIERLTILLDLDPYQAGEVQRVFTAQRDAMKAERQQRRAAGGDHQRPSFEEMQAKRQANETAVVAQLSTVLSDTQIMKLKVLMESPPRGGRGPHGGPPPGAPSDVPAAK